MDRKEIAELQIKKLEESVWALEVQYEKDKISKKEALKKAYVEKEKQCRIVDDLLKKKHESLGRLHNQEKDIRLTIHASEEEYKNIRELINDAERRYALIQKKSDDTVANTDKLINDVKIDRMELRREDKKMKEMFAAKEDEFLGREKEAMRLVESHMKLKMQTEKKLEEVKIKSLEIIEQQIALKQGQKDLQVEREKFKVRHKETLARLSRIDKEGKELVDGWKRLRTNEMVLSNKEKELDRRDKVTKDRELDVTAREADVQRLHARTETLIDIHGLKDKA